MGDVGVRIYTGNADGESLDKVESLGMGIMIASSPTWEPRKSYRRVPCALDNGAFQCWRRGFPFQADVFLRSVAKCYEVGLSLEFIVCPDIVAGGLASLDFSREWAHGELRTAQRLALVVQDGMETRDVKPDLLRRFTHLFVGGTPEWKWRTAAEWVNHAHAYGLKCHIGRCGTLPLLRAAQRAGADSVDSTNFVRNQSWAVVEEFRGGGQMEIDCA